MDNGIQNLSVEKKKKKTRAIHWIVIHPVGSVIHLRTTRALSIVERGTKIVGVTCTEFR